MGLGAKVPQKRLSAERLAVMVWLAIYLLCAALGVYSTATTAADLVKEELTRAASLSPAR